MPSLNLNEQLPALEYMLNAIAATMAFFAVTTFKESVANAHQTITHSGVGGHHHNGSAENAIKFTVQRAQAMMVHATMQWPECHNNKLCPLALKHAAQLHKATPNTILHLSPEEIWNWTRSTHSTLTNDHTWGCSVYMLHLQLQDGEELSKWKLRAQRGQYVGRSPNHASSVALVRHLWTNNLSPQFHIVFDNQFQTVYSPANEIPPEWEELFLHSHNHPYIDDAVPDLDEEWIDKDKLAKQKATEEMTWEQGTQIEPCVPQQPDTASNSRPSVIQSPTDEGSSSLQSFLPLLSISIPTAPLLSPISSLLQDQGARTSPRPLPEPPS